jgi:DNA-binding MarR family transcriptional regulator
MTGRLPQMSTDDRPPGPSGPADGPDLAAVQPVAVIDESIRESFLLLDALDRRTLGSLTPPLTCAQFHALVALERDPGQSLSALATKLLCAKANASGLVDRLSGMDLVARETDPEDARRIRLALTPRGAGLLEVAKRERYVALTAELTALHTGNGLPLDELARLMRSMVMHLRNASIAGAAPARARRRPPTERQGHGRPARRGRARR